MLGRPGRMPEALTPVVPEFDAGVEGSARRGAPLPPQQLGDRANAADFQLGQERDEDPSGGQGVALGGVASHHLDVQPFGDTLEAEVPPLRVQRGGETMRVDDVVVQARQPTGSTRPSQDRGVEPDVVTDQHRAVDHTFSAAQDSFERRRAAHHPVRQTVNRRRLGRDRPSRIDEGHVSRGGNPVEERNRGQRDDRVPARIETGRLEIDGDEALPHGLQLQRV